MGNAAFCSDEEVGSKARDRRVRAGPARTFQPEDPAVSGKRGSECGNSSGNSRSKAPPKSGGLLGQCCTTCVHPDSDFTERKAEREEIIDPRQIKIRAPRIPGHPSGFLEAADVAFSPPELEKGQACDSSPCPQADGKLDGIRWERWRPILMAILMVLTSVLSSLVPSGEDSQVPSLESFLRYGSIPLVAAIIGYGTNVVALQMMFLPLEFMGCFPDWKIGCGLDLPLCGWQGVIPMKAVEMATISVDLMTQKLIKVEEIFSRLDPQRVSEEVADVLPDIVSEVINAAGRRHCPKLWEHLPIRARKQLEDGVAAESMPMMARFIHDLQKNISTVFDLKACVVDVMVSDRRILNDTFLLCGAKEFEFIRVSGFYLGFLFGLIQMIVWMFVKEWWILPLCGVFVGYLTNVVALKVIFLPVEPRKVLNVFTVQGLFLQRQHEVSALYAKQCAERILAADTLMHGLANGPSSDKMYELVDKHVAACMEDQAMYYKPMFLVSIGSETWADFRAGVCLEFRTRLPALLTKIQKYTQETLQLEGTLRNRLQNLPPRDFERLLHAVFEQDEIKLILVGAILGAIVGFLQALAQTPEQLGLA